MYVMQTTTLSIWQDIILRMKAIVYEVIIDGKTFSFSDLGLAHSSMILVACFHILPKVYFWDKVGERQILP